MNKDDIEISVIVPVFNIENELESCLESLVAQTYKGFEVVVIDDGSTDRCAKIIESFAAKDSRFRVLTKCNGGLARARIDGVRLATGRYVFHLDGDDFLPLNALEKLYEHAQRSKADIIGGSHRRYFFGSGDVVCIDKRSRIEKAEFIRIMYSKNYFYVWGKLIKRELCEPFPEGIGSISYGEDTVLMTELALRASSVSFVDDVVYAYRIRPNSLSNKPSKAAVESRLRATAMACRNVRNNLVGSLAEHDVDLYFLTQIYRHLMDGGDVGGCVKAEIHSEMVKSMKGVVRAALRKKSLKMFLVLQAVRLNINMIYIFSFIKYIIDYMRRIVRLVKQ